MVNNCLICLGEIDPHNDPLGKAWLSCACKQEYHAMCLNRWLFTDDIATPGRARYIKKGCPLCQESDDSIYIVDFIPPHDTQIKEEEEEQVLSSHPCECRRRRRRRITPPQAAQPPPKQSFFKKLIKFLKN